MGLHDTAALSIHDPDGAGIAGVGAPLVKPLLFYLSLSPGWEPKKNRNLTWYVRPEENTIKLCPLSTRLKVVSYFYRKKLTKYKQLKST